MTGLGFGMAPALAVTRGNLTAPLKDSGGIRRVSTLPSRRTSLVVAQIALSLLLLVMAGLFTRTLQRLHGLDPERDMAKVAAANIDLGLLKYTPDRGPGLSGGSYWRESNRSRGRRGGDRAVRAVCR